MADPISAGGRRGSHGGGLIMHAFDKVRGVIPGWMKQPRALIGVAVVAGIIGVTGGAALATRSASDHFADKAFSKLGGDSDEILDKLADKLVDRLSEKGGTLDGAQDQLVGELADMAGSKLE